MIEDIIAKRNVYIIPFMFENKSQTFNEIVYKINNSGSWMIEESINLESDLYKNILDSFYMNDGDSNIGCSFKYSDKTFDFRYTRFDEDIKVVIKNVGLFIFRTNIGFLWYEAIIDCNDLDKCILFQNEFKELSYLRFTKKELNDRYIFELDDNYLLMGDYINKNYLNDLPFNIKYFAERVNYIDNTIIPDKALIFNYVIFNDINENDLYDAIFHLNNGYNKKYKRKASFKNELLETFDKTYYYATSSGAGYYAIADKDNYNFYTKTLYKKIMLDYFYLYILALYQSYSILKYTIDMENKLSANRNAYLNNSKETLRVLKDLETDISIFFIKSIYSSVSHISHQNDFYNYLIKQLNVKEDIDDLTIGLDSLYKIENEKEKERIEQLKEEENKERENMLNRLNIGIGLISVFAILSIVPDGYETAKILSDLFGLEYKLCLSIIMIISLILMIILMLIGINVFIKYIKVKKGN